MKKIPTHLILATWLTSGFVLFYFKGFSTTTFYINVATFLVITIFEMGRKYGFNQKLPRQKPSTTIILLIRYVLGIILYSMANAILNKDLFKTLLSSKSFLAVLWLWILFELIVDFKKAREYPSNL